MCRPLLYNLFGHSQEERNVQMLRGLHGSLEHIHLCAEIVEFKKMSISKAGFLEKFGSSKYSLTTYIHTVKVHTAKDLIKK